MNARIARLIRKVARALNKPHRPGKRLWMSTPWTRRGYEAKMMRVFLTDKERENAGR